MSLVPILRHMVKDEESNLEKLFGVSVSTFTMKRTALSLEIKRVAIQCAYSIPWVLNNQSSSCMNCNSSFGIMKWRHHCRGCGYLVCNSCSKNKSSVPELNESGGSRICDCCVKEGKKAQELATEAVVEVAKEDIQSARAKQASSSPAASDSSMGATDSETSDFSSTSGGNVGEDIIAE